MKIFDGDVFRQYLLNRKAEIKQKFDATSISDDSYIDSVSTVTIKRELLAAADEINAALKQLDSTEVEVHQVPKGGAVLLRINNNYNMAEFCEYWDTIKDSFISADVQAVAISDAAYKIDIYSNLDDMITDIENLLKYLKGAKEAKDAT